MKSQRIPFGERLAGIVPAAVYGGAGLLVLIVGLRGLGNVSNFIPQIFLGPDGRLSPTVVGTGLVAEFVLLMLMAFVVFLKSRVASRSTGEQDGLESALVHMEEYTQSMNRKVEALVVELTKVVRKFDQMIEGEKCFVEALNEHIGEETSIGRNLLVKINENTDHLREVQQTMQRVFRV